MLNRNALKLAAALAVVLAAGAAEARGGGSMGESYNNDQQRNPRFIEPYSDYNPSRYRMSHPGAGYDDRQIAAGGYGPYWVPVPVRRYRY